MINLHKLFNNQLSFVMRLNDTRYFRVQLILAAGIGQLLTMRSDWAAVD